MIINSDLTLYLFPEYVKVFLLRAFTMYTSTPNCKPNHKTFNPNPNVHLKPHHDFKKSLSKMFIEGLMEFENAMRKRISYITEGEFLLDTTYGSFKDTFNKGLYKYKK